MKIKYVGFDTGLQIAATGQLVDPGDVVEVDDALGKNLTQQDIWEPVKAPAKKEK
jgi:hypothetical protein